MTDQNITPEQIAKIVDALRRGVTVAQAAGIKKETLEGLYAVGRNLYVAGNYKDAKVVFQALSIYDYNDPRFWLGLAGCRQAREEYEGAIDAYQMAALAGEMKNPEPLLFAVQCLLKLNRREDAIAGLKALLVIGDKNAYAECRSKARALLEMLEPVSGEAK